MFADPLTINDGVINQSYHRLRENGKKSWYVQANAATNPKIQLRVLHTKTRPIKGDPTYVVDRHIFTITRSEYDAVNGRYDTATLNFTMSLPNNGNLTRAECDLMSGTLVAFLGNSGNLDKFYREEL